jgi:hypothetical protein
MATRTPQDRKPKQPIKAKQPDVRFMAANVVAVFTLHNDKGEVIQQVQTEPMPVFKPDFPNFSRLMNEALANVKAQVAAQQNGSPE